MTRLIMLSVLQMLCMAVIGAQSITCAPKDGLAFEKEVCARIAKIMDHYAPVHVTPNRTLNHSVIEFSASSESPDGIIASVLVKDPIGRNVIKLILPANATPAVVGDQAVVALGKILERPATATNVGWVIVIPPTSAVK